MPDVCLTLSFPIALDERVFDALLHLPEIGVFTSTSGAAHGMPHALLSAREQVRGHAAITLVHTLVAQTSLDALLASVRAQFGGTSLRYWVMPILAQGDFS